jgi:ABC-type tungstate transport system permease subunit
MVPNGKKIVLVKATKACKGVEYNSTKPFPRYYTKESGQHHIHANLQSGKQPLLAINEEDSRPKRQDGRLEE